MSSSEIKDIKKAIIIEKSNFILNNSTYFNQKFKEDLITLKSILLNPAPLKQCDGYNELMQDIKKSQIRNIPTLSYQNSLEVLFTIVYYIRANIISSEQNKHEQVETIRKYVKCVSTHDSGKIYYDNQKIVSLNSEKIEQIKKETIEENEQRKRTIR
ncbi:MAG: hypothetical protein MR388_02305 [Tenericutes bacterium]|nr:hypothetical protein [Mycoplasmatota bacterium]